MEARLDSAGHTYGRDEGEPRDLHSARRSWELSCARKKRACLGGVESGMDVCGRVKVGVQRTTVLVGCRREGGCDQTGDVSGRPVGVVDVLLFTCGRLIRQLCMRRRRRSSSGMCGMDGMHVYGKAWIYAQSVRCSSSSCLYFSHPTFGMTFWICEVRLKVVQQREHAATTHRNRPDCEESPSFLEPLRQAPHAKRLINSHPSID